ncbi:MAG: Lrp/AsnC family transcriptional regulator [Erysipelotrichaceae bacterium]|nr:Lrp/AsnC family transcriptional regulator [Erysipelotrichaceae bacterium]
MDEIKLLNVLKNDPRISTEDLADILNEDVDDVAKTKLRLEKEKIICGYHTVINWDKTNTEVCSAVIEVSAKPERDKGYDQVAARIARYPEVKTLYLISGRSEFLVLIDGKTMKEVADFVGQKLAPIEGITQTVTLFVLKKYKIEGVELSEKEKDERMLLSL